MDPSAPQTYEPGRFYGSEILHPLPQDDPMLWDIEEEAACDVCTSLFVGEYLYDFNARNAMERLGVPDEQALDWGKHYLKHWMVKRKMREAISRFREHKIATEDSAFAMVWRDASYHGPDANPIARVAAQKVLIKILCMEPEDKRKAESNTDSNERGVLLVYNVDNMQDWEEQAAASQAFLKQEVKKEAERIPS